MAEYALKVFLSCLLLLVAFCSAVYVPLEEQNSTAVSPFLHSVEAEESGNCTPAAILEFPNDGLTRQERRRGWIAIYLILAIYSIILLSTVCDDYFVPAIQTLVTHLDIPEDVAGASFMAITSASPELFVNFVGTFITQGDIGVGTVVGSNVFNVLAVPACCLFSKMTFQLDWYSMTRDCLVYGISVVLLITTLWDDRVLWYEALLFLLVYALYILVMYYNEHMQRIVKRKGRTSVPTKEVPMVPIHSDNEAKKLMDAEEGNFDSGNNATNHLETINEKVELTYELKNDTTEESSSFWSRSWGFFTFPINQLFKWTIPDCKRSSTMYRYTLLMCMVWIGVGSYLLTWFITVIGDTLSIPDSVVGLSFVAVGSSIPEVVSCIIISRHGQGAMGISSALGANTFEILLCLGLPWLLKTAIHPKTPGNHWIVINSSGLAYNAGSLFSTLVFLYICLLFNRFKLDWKIGGVCLIAYIIFLIVGTLIELNYFFPVNLPTCEV